jgi:hypothetical protein
MTDVASEFDSEFDSDLDAADSDDACSIESADSDCFSDEQEEEGWDDDSSSGSSSIDEQSDYAVLRVLARAIARSGANRVMSFHSRAKVGDVCVRAFATPQNQQLLVQLLQQFGADYQRVRLEGVTAEDGKRQQLLQQFDATPDDEVFVLASCCTIGEGVDTKNTDMVFFTDPRGSDSATIQVRRVLQDLVCLLCSGAWAMIRRLVAVLVCDATAVCVTAAAVGSPCSSYMAFCRCVLMNAVLLQAYT